MNLLNENKINIFEEINNVRNKIEDSKFNIDILGNFVNKKNIKKINQLDKINNDFNDNVKIKSYNQKNINLESYIDNKEINKKNNKINNKGYKFGKLTIDKFNNRKLIKKKIEHYSNGNIKEKKLINDKTVEPNINNNILRKNSVDNKKANFEYDFLNDKIVNKYIIEFNKIFENYLSKRTQINSNYFFNKNDLLIFKTQKLREVFTTCLESLINQIERTKIFKYEISQLNKSIKFKKNEYKYFFHNKLSNPNHNNDEINELKIHKYNEERDFLNYKIMKEQLIYDIVLKINPMLALKYGVEIAKRYNYNFNNDISSDEFIFKKLIENDAKFNIKSKILEEFNTNEKTKKLFLNNLDYINDISSKDKVNFILDYVNFKAKQLKIKTNNSIDNIHKNFSVINLHHMNNNINSENNNILKNVENENIFCLNSNNENCKNDKLPNIIIEIKTLLNKNYPNVFKYFYEFTNKQIEEINKLINIDLLNNIQNCNSQEILFYRLSLLENELIDKISNKLPNIYMIKNIKKKKYYK